MSGRYFACAAASDPVDAGTHDNPPSPAADSSCRARETGAMLCGDRFADDGPISVLGPRDAEIGGTLRRALGVAAPAVGIGHGTQRLRHGVGVVWRDQDAVRGERHARPNLLAPQVGE